MWLLSRGNPYLHIHATSATYSNQLTPMTPYLEKKIATITEYHAKSVSLDMVKCQKPLFHAMSDNRYLTI